MSLHLSTTTQIDYTSFQGTPNSLRARGVTVAHQHPRSLIMCATPEDLRSRAAWDGIVGDSRRSLLVQLQGTSHMSRLLDTY